MPSQSCHFSVSLVLIFVVFYIHMAVSLSTTDPKSKMETTTTSSQTASKPTDTSSSASSTTTSTVTTSTTTASPTTTATTQPITTEPPAYLGANCSSEDLAWCNESISGNAICNNTSHKCVCNADYFRVNRTVCITKTSLKPENINFTDITSTSLVVHWQMTESLTWEFNVTVTGTQSDEQSPSVDLGNTTASLDKLKPGDEYNITVTAYFINDENEVYSDLDSKKQAIDPAKPGNVIQGTYEAPNITLKWNASDGIVQEYTVHFDNRNYTTGNNVSEVALTGLTAGTNYSVTITATSNGRTSEERIDQFTTVVEAPSPPQNLANSSRTNTSITLTWDPPTETNGILTGYLVCYQGKVYQDLEKYSMRDCKNVRNVTSYKVNSLTPGAFYDFKVYSFNTDFNSTDSANLSLRTLESVPGKVEGLAVEVSNNSFIVTWKRPSEPNGDIIMYKIDWHGDGLNCLDFLNTNRSNSTSQNPANCSSTSGENIQVNQENMNFTISALSPFTNYTVEVTSFTTIGEGTRDSTIRMTSVGKPDPVTNVMAAVLNSTVVLVNWTIPKTFPGPVNYTVKTYDMINNGVELTQIYTVVGYNSTQCEVTGLEEYWVYQFGVEASTSADSSYTVRSENTTTDEGVPGKVQKCNATPFDSVDKCDATKVSLSWEEPVRMERNAKIVAYIVSNAAVPWEDVTYPVIESDPYRPSSKTFTKDLKDLQAETNYKKQIKAKTEGNKQGQPCEFEFSTSSCAPPAWPNTASIKKTKESTTTSFTVALPREFFTNIRQGHIKETGLIISKRNESINLSTAKDNDWNNAKKNNFGTAYAIKIEIKDSENFEVTVGINKTCPEGSGTACNGEIPADEEFYVMAFACTKDSKCRPSPWFGGFRTAAKPVPPPEPNTGAVVAGVLVALGLVILIGAVFLLHRRGVINLTKFCPGGDEDPPPFDKVQPASPVKFSDFDNYVQELHKDTNLLFSCQYEDIGKLSKVIYDRCSTYAANLEENKAKNRWVNILPFDHSRVKLQQLDDDDPTSDYINANFIPGFRHQRDYIATQGPLPGTIDDFWRMVWEHSVAVIVMLTQCKEGNRVKCEPYWPTEIHEPKQYGDVVVDPVSISTMNKYNITIFNVSVNDVKRMVYHFHYLEFPDMSANVEYDIFLEFLQAVRNHVPRDLDSPIVVHCSAGVGRTGTFIALDRLSQAINKSDFNWNDLVDIFDMVIGMRSNRTNMVQTESQYIMIHDCLCKMLEMKKRTEMSNSDENLYVNQAFDPDTDVLYENLKAKNEMKTDL